MNILIKRLRTWNKDQDDKLYFVLRDCDYSELAKAGFFEMLPDTYTRPFDERASVYIHKSGTGMVINCCNEEVPAELMGFSEESVEEAKKSLITLLQSIVKDRNFSSKISAFPNKSRRNKRGNSSVLDYKKNFLKSKKSCRFLGTEKSLERFFSNRLLHPEGWSLFGDFSLARKFLGCSRIENSRICYDLMINHEVFNSRHKKIKLVDIRLEGVAE